MAVLAIGLIGSAIGSAIGGTFLGVAAASWGFVGGQIVGNLLFPQKSSAEGPRIGDLSVQSSTYGVGKPIIYGTMRTSGNVIFCTDKREVKSEQEQGGKGGPTVTTTTYKYNVDMAVALCEGPIVGIRKVWSNGKLIYDASEDADVGSVVASSMHANSFKVYLGDETQLPDPTIEATVTAGLTPAYRGTAYVVFDHLDCPNGQVPQLSFEVVGTGAHADSSPIFSVVPGETPTCYSAIVENKAWQFKSAVNVVRAQQVGPDYYTYEGLRDFTDPYGQSTLPPVPVQGGPYAMFATFSNVSYSFAMSVVVVNLENGQRRSLITYIPGSSANSMRPYWAAYDSVTEKFCAVAAGADGIDRSEFITIMPANILTEHIMTEATPLAFYDNVIYTCGVDAGVTYLNSYDGDTGLLIESISSGANNGAISLLVHASSDGVYVVDNDPDDISRDRHVWRVDSDGWHVLSSTVHYDNLSGFVRTWWSNSDYGIVGPSVEDVSGNVIYRAIRYNVLSTDNVTVGDIIADLCERAGLQPSQIDTSDITGTVHGYALNQVASARADIDPLMRAYFIDAVESDGELKFLQRAGKTTVASVNFDDLGAVEPGNNAADALALTRTQEAELPRSVALTFINKDADFQPGTETARRQVTDSVYDVVDQLPIATNSEHMASVAATLLYDAWALRSVRKATLPRSYAHLDPSDNVTVEYPQGTFTSMRITRMTDTGLLLQVDLVNADPDVYTVTVPGATPAQAQAGVEYAGPTRMVLLDIPLLRDADDSAGLYAAVQGYSSSWSGAAIYGGDTVALLSLLTTVGSTAAIMGNAVTVLGDWQLGMFDEIHTVDVTLVAGVLSNASREDVLDTDTNACLVGNEILQFRTATSLGSNTWRLSGLLRGRRGTEWAAALHAAGEPFVLLSATGGMVRLPMDLADVGAARSYKVVSTQQTNGDGIIQSFTNTAAGLKPLAPGMFDVATDGVQIALRWIRRSRYRDNFLIGTVPLAESSEAYEVDVTAATGETVTYSTTETALTVNAASYVAGGLPGRGAQFAISSGGYLYALDATGRIWKREAVGLLPISASSVSLPQPSGMVLSGSEFFVVNGGDPAAGVYGKLTKFDVGLNVTGQLDLPAYNDGYTLGHSIVACASSLWVALGVTGVVRRIDPTTMLTVANVTYAGAGMLATDGTYVYAVAIGGSSLVKIDPSTNAIVATYAIAGPAYSDFVVAGGYAFVGGWDGQARIHRTSDGRRVDNTFSADVTGMMSVASTYVAFCTYGGKITVIDTATLTVRGTAQIDGGGAYGATLLDADTVVASSQYGALADYYERVVFGSGTEINLYQISADVGRGFAATRTI
jgi:hypothetical protein